MANEASVVEEEGDLSHEEAEIGQAGRPDGRASKLGKLMKVTIYLPMRDVLAVEEIRMKYLRQGTDVHRSRLISEAIKLLAHAASDGKFELRG